MTSSCLRDHRPCGAVALPVALAMALAMLLYIGIVHGSLLTEQRLSANRYRAAVAFEAADAGIDFMLGRLNAGDPVDARCQPESSPDLPSFREQQAGQPDGQGAWAPGGIPVLCSAEGTGWACQCGAPALPAAAQPSVAPSAATFTVQMHPGTPADLLRIESVGCSNPAQPCVPVPGRADAQARIAVSIGHVPALAQVPAAALTVHGDLHLGSSPWILQHPSASGGLALHTGGTVVADRLATLGPPGAPARSTVLASDPALLGTERSHTFSRLFRMDAAAWQALPTVRRVDCPSACDNALRNAVGPGGHHTMLWLNGGLHLEGPLQLGTPSRPVVIIADGPIALRGPLTVHGLVYTTSSHWQAPAGADIFGAVVAEGALRGNGITRIRHDAEVLQALHDRTGTFVRVPGSWKDFE